MKIVFLFLSIILFAGVVVVLSCKKEKTSGNFNNVSPIADAGPDILVTQAPCGLLNWTELDGTGSSDPDGNIVYYEWQKISGPSQAVVGNNGDVKPIVLDIRSGLYAFELLVKDDKGASSRDTVLVDATQWTLRAYDLDITINGNYIAYYGWEDCDVEYGTCTYQDVIQIRGKGVFPPLGQFNLYLMESSETSASDSRNHFFRLQSESNIGDMMFLEGINDAAFPVLFKKIIQNVGGAFDGTVKIYSGSANACAEGVYDNLPPLNVTGSIDTFAQKITVNIKGRIYF